jgi:Domain of unknown function DUF11/PASTA domain
MCEVVQLRYYLSLAVSVLLVALGAPASAGALTLGDLATVDPGPCSISTSAWVEQTASMTATYVVPAPGGVITSWSTSFGPPGAPVELVVSSPFNSASTPTSDVRGIDAETLPSPLPASNVSTFTLTHPTGVQAGDVFGLFYTNGANTRCAFGGAASDGGLAGYDQPVQGGHLSGPFPLTNSLVNVTVNVVQTNDVGLSAATRPSTIALGDLADLAFKVSGGPAASATFTDVVPAGLVPVSASTGNGSCTISSQSVSCALSSVPSNVDITVQGSSPGMYTDSGQVTNPVPDTNLANNSASATLAVVSPGPGCTVPKLRGFPLRLAKQVIPLVHCRVGKVKRVASSRIPKGDVIATSPAAGRTSPAGTAVAITVSAGRHGRHH